MTDGTVRLALVVFGSAARRLGGSAARRLGGSAAWRRGGACQLVRRGGSPYPGRMTRHPPTRRGFGPHPRDAGRRLLLLPACTKPAPGRSLGARADRAGHHPVSPTGPAEITPPSPGMSTSWAAPWICSTTPPPPSGRSPRCSPCGRPGDGEPGKRHHHTGHRGAEAVHFRAPEAAYGAVAAAGVDVVSIGNNHALDYGRVGLGRHPRVRPPDRYAECRPGGPERRTGPGSPP